MGSNSNPDVWFILTGSTTLSPGVTRTVTFNNPTIGDLLTNFSTQGTFEGDYWSNLQSYGAKFVFDRSGGYTFYDSTGPCQPILNNCTYSSVRSGTATMVSWPAYSSIVTFKLCPTCANILFSYPFASFMYQNGPESWPIIEYVRQ